MTKTIKTLCSALSAAVIMTTVSVPVAAQSKSKIVTAKSDLAISVPNPGSIQYIRNDVYRAWTDKGTEFIVIDDEVIEAWKTTGKLSLIKVNLDEQAEAAAQYQLNVPSTGIGNTGLLEPNAYDDDFNKMQWIMKYDEEEKSISTIASDLENPYSGLLTFNDGTIASMEWEYVTDDVYNCCFSYYNGEDFFKPEKTVRFLDAFGYGGGPNAKYYFCSVKNSDGSFSVKLIDSKGHKKTLAKNLDDVKIIQSYEDVIAFAATDRSDNKRYTWIFDVEGNKLHKLSDRKLERFSCQGKKYIVCDMGSINNGKITIEYLSDDNTEIKSMLFDLDNEEFISKVCNELGRNFVGNSPVLYSGASGKYSYFMPNGERAGVRFDDAAEFKGETALVRKGDYVYFIDKNMKRISEKLKLGSEYGVVTISEDIAAAYTDTDMMLMTLKDAKRPAEQKKFTYVHDPRNNPDAMEDIIENPDAVYGFSPNHESKRLGDFAGYDWTDPKAVVEYRAARIEYHQSMNSMHVMLAKLNDEGKSIEEIARAISAERNRIRLDSYKNDPEGLEKVKASNLETYGHEDGPDADSLYEKYGSWEMVLVKAFSPNAGMDACTGLYDDYYQFYINLGLVTE